MSRDGRGEEGHGGPARDSQARRTIRAVRSNAPLLRARLAASAALALAEIYTKCCERGGPGPNGERAARRRPGLDQIDALQHPRQRSLYGAAAVPPGASMHCRDWNNLALGIPRGEVLPGALVPARSSRGSIFLTFALFWRAFPRVRPARSCTLDMLQALEFTLLRCSGGPRHSCR